jgi:hypothetical protein
LAAAALAFPPAWRLPRGLLTLEGSDRAATRRRLNRWILAYMVTTSLPVACPSPR